MSLRYYLFPLGLALIAHDGSAQRGKPPTVELRPGMIITRSVRIAPRTYQLSPRSPDSVIVTVRGNDITVDFNGATVQGTAIDANPDLARGVGILVDGGRNVRIQNAKVRGYRFGLIARGTHGLSLLGNDFSYNWKPRLYSVVEHESLIDWLSFHHNENNEWQRYGAGAYLADVEGGSIHDNTVTQGMNGLMLVRTSGLAIWNNDFSFNSGLGVGLYRSTGNRIMHNHVDYDVRGYSEGFYRRGQDAADLLMYEQSSKNIVAYNTMTHGGDGLFLWAGQSTMDTGEGGANDNFFYGNDFSFSPANGIETTFSRNTFISNFVEGSEYGVWGGYSFDTQFLGNIFHHNRTGIAIEHGQNNIIASNLFDRDSTAIRLWGDPIEPSDWGYPKHRDTRSREYVIAENIFDHNRVGARVATTGALRITGNRFVAVDSLAVTRDTSGYLFADNAVGRIFATFQSEESRILQKYRAMAPAPIGGNTALPHRAAAGSAAALPRSAIVVDEWGPYDYRSPKLWPIDSTHSDPLRLRTLGPVGRWRVVSRRGLSSVTPAAGKIGDTITVIPATTPRGDWLLTLEYAGAAVTSPRGRRSAARAPYRFSYGMFEPRIAWNARFFQWSDSTLDPRKNPQAMATITRGVPVLTQTLSRLDYEGYRAIPGLPRENFALEATGSVDLPAGVYTLRTISDDGIRVWVDDKLVIDDFNVHESTLDFATLRGGHHDLRVEYFQGDGWYELRLDIVRGIDRSPGSPGAHGS